MSATSRPRGRPRGEKPLNHEPCTICGKPIKYLADVPRHYKTHHPDRQALKTRCPYPDCDYASLQRSNVSNHVRSRHRRKLYYCKKKPCLYCTLDKKELAQHKEGVHKIRCDPSDWEDEMPEPPVAAKKPKRVVAGQYDSDDGMDVSHNTTPIEYSLYYLQGYHSAICQIMALSQQNPFAQAGASAPPTPIPDVSFQQPMSQPQHASTSPALSPAASVVFSDFSSSTTSSPSSTASSSLPSSPSPCPDELPDVLAELERPLPTISFDDVKPDAVRDFGYLEPFNYSSFFTETDPSFELDPMSSLFNYEHF